MGDKGEPWGISVLIYTGFDEHSLVLIMVLRFCVKLAIQDMIWGSSRLFRSYGLAGAGIHYQRRRLYLASTRTLLLPGPMLRMFFLLESGLACSVEVFLLPPKCVLGKR